MYNKTNSNITFTNINGSSNAYINKNISYENNNFELHDKGELDYESLDIDKISTSVTGAKNGEYVKANEEIFKSADLSYEIVDDNVAVIKNGDVPIGYTTTDGLNIVNREDGYSSVIEEIDTNSFSETKPNAPTNSIDYSNLRKQVNNTDNSNETKFYGPMPMNFSKVEKKENVVNNNSKSLDDLEDYKNYMEKAREANEIHNNLVKMLDESYDEKKPFSKKGKTYGIDGKQYSYDYKTKNADGSIDYVKDNVVYKTIYPNGVVKFSDYSSSKGASFYRLNDESGYDLIVPNYEVRRYTATGCFYYGGTIDPKGALDDLKIKWYTAYDGAQNFYYDTGELESHMSPSGSVTAYNKDGKVRYESTKDYTITYEYNDDGSEKIKYEYPSGSYIVSYYAKNSTSPYKIEYSDGRVKNITKDGYEIELPNDNGTEYYNNDDVLQYTITGNTKTYPDGTTETEWENYYHKYNPDGTSYEKKLDNNNTTVENYYDSEHKLTKTYMNGKLKYEYKSNGDCYNYDLNTGDINSISNSSGTSYYKDGNIVCFRDTNGDYQLYNKELFERPENVGFYGYGPDENGKFRYIGSDGNLYY